MSKRRASFSPGLLVVIALSALSCSETSTPTEPALQATVTINLKSLGLCSLSAVRVKVDGARSIDVPVSVLSVTFTVSAGHHTYAVEYTNTATPPETFTGMSGTFDVQAGMPVEISLVGNVACAGPL